MKPITHVLIYPDHALAINIDDFIAESQAMIDEIEETMAVFKKDSRPVWSTPQLTEVFGAERDELLSVR
jgi:hypothetical protein